MAAPTSPQKKENTHTVEKRDLKKISDHELVRLCRNDHRPAWEEFFRRFIPTIKDAIKRKLSESNSPVLADKENVISEIHMQVANRLLYDDILEAEPDDIESWLYSVAKNKTIDWLNWQGRDKRLPKKQLEASTISISSPVGRDGDLTVEGTIVSEPESSEGLDTENEYFSLGIDAVRNKKQRWALRLSIILYYPFSEREVEELSKFSGLSKKEISTRLEEMRLEAQKRELERIKTGERAVFDWYKIMRKEFVLSEKSKDPSEEGQKQAERLREEVRKAKIRRAKNLKRGNNYSLSRPSNNSIASMIGLEEEDEDQVGNLINRAIESLAKTI